MNKFLASLVALTGVLTAATFLTLGGSSNAASITFIGRGIVKPGGGANSLNVYWTHVPASVERIEGVRADVSTGSATKSVWNVNTAGTLVKTKVASLPTPEKEVEIRGVLHSDDRVTASWIVTNYRQFKIKGKIQGVAVDTGKSDEGFVTVNGTSSEFRNVIPIRPFKTGKVIGQDIIVRVNGLTTVTSLGKSKTLDEVSTDQQSVIIEGEIQNEGAWVASKFNEVN